MKNYYWLPDRVYSRNLTYHATYERILEIG